MPFTHTFCHSRPNTTDWFPQLTSPCDFLTIINFPCSTSSSLPARPAPSQSHLQLKLILKRFAFCIIFFITLVVSFPAPSKAVTFFPHPVNVPSSPSHIPTSKSTSKHGHQRQVNFPALSFPPLSEPPHPFIHRPEALKWRRKAIPCPSRHAESRECPRTSVYSSLPSYTYVFMPCTATSHWQLPAP